MVFNVALRELKLPQGTHVHHEEALNILFGHALL